MADSAARVRVFSDDGNCVSDAVLMRRALEYVKAFDGVIAQHAQEPRLTEGAQMNEGELSGGLGLTGWPAVAEEAIIARDVLLAAHVGSRLHVCHVSTAGSVEIMRWAKAQGLGRHRRGDPAPPAAHRRAGRRRYDPVFKVNPPLRTARPTSRRCARRWPTAPSTPSPPTTPRTPLEDKECEWAGRGLGMLGLETALSVVQEAMVETGLLDWAGVADRMSHAPGPDRPGSTATAGRSPSGAPANLVLVDPAARAGRSTRARWPPAAATPRTRACTLPGRGGGDLPARPADRRSTGSWRVERARQHVRRCSSSRTAGPSAARPTARPARPSARRSSPPA